MKAKVLSAKYRLKNLGKKNDLDWKDQVEVEETEQREVTWDIEEGIQNLARQNCILKSMAIGQFLNLQGEEVDDDLEVIMNEIAKAYSTSNKTHETNEEDVVIPKLGAMKAFQKLCLYKKQYENGDSEWISRINWHKRLMWALGFQGLKQSSIRGFFWVNSLLYLLWPRFL